MAGGDVTSEAAALLAKHADLLGTRPGTVCRVETCGRRDLIEALTGKTSDRVISIILEREGVEVREGSLQRHRTGRCLCRR